jgi:hypothetical protein
MMRKVLFSALMIGFAGIESVQAADICHESQKQLEFFDRNAVIQNLIEQQEAGKKIFATQQDYDGPIMRRGGGGACATVAGVNLVQIVRARMGISKPLSSDRVIRQSMRDLPELRIGRVTNSQFRNYIQYLTQFIPGVSARAEIDQIERAGEVHRASGWKDWKQMPPEAIFKPLAPQQMRIVMYKVMTPEGEFFGRHFVIVRDIKGPDQIVVHDGYRPTKTLTYQLAAKISPETGEPTLQLVRPGTDSAGNLNFVIDSVMTVSFSRE